MGIKVKLIEKVSSDTWSATGTFTGINRKDERISMPIEVLLKQTAKNELKLVLNSKIKVSKLGDKEITLYTNAKPVIVENIAAGIEVSFIHIWIDFNKKQPL